MKASKAKRPKAVRCYAWIEDDEIMNVYVGLQSREEVLREAPCFTGGRWEKVEVRPVVAPKRKPRKKA